MSVDVWQQLCTASATLDRLQRDHRAVTANMAADSHQPTGGSIDIGGAVEWTLVEAAALRRIATQATRYQLLIQQALVALLEADVIRGLTVTADTAKIATEDRCDGGAGEWADPTCERIALNDGNKPRAIWIDGRQHQLCKRCWDRYRQRQHRELSA